MIDLHLHVLPGVDDGAATPEEARAMLEELREIGFHRAVTTPHLMQPLDDEYRHLVDASYNLVEPLARESGIELSLGFEHLLSPGLADRLDRGESTTMAGSCSVLVELPFMTWPVHAESSLFRLRTAGYRPILAHPERYLAVQKRPDLAIQAGRAGSVFQLTAASFTGVYGRDAERSVKHLLAQAIEHDISVILATDAHSSGRRLAAALPALERIRHDVDRGELVVEWATTVVPQRLLDDEHVPAFIEWLEDAGHIGPGREWRRRHGVRRWDRAIQRVLGRGQGLP